MDITEIRRLEEQKVGTPKLSEAIRIGAKMRPQCFGSVFNEACTCAIGAAAEGGGWVFGKNDYMDFVRDVPIALRTEIIMRNSSDMQTREQIADYVQAQGY